MPSDRQFAGIDPGQLEELIGALDRRVGSSARTLDELHALFHGMGLDTADITAIRASVDWGRRQLPMLRIRHALADAMGGPDPAPALEGLLERSGETSCAQALYLALGARGIAALGVQRRRYLDRGHRAEAELLERSVGLSLAAASHDMPIDDEWLDEVSEKGEGFEPALLAPLMRHGTFCDQWLEVIGERLLAAESPDSGGLWEIIARHPGFAARFCAAHETEITRIEDRPGVAVLLRSAREHGAQSPPDAAHHSAPAGAR